MLNASASYFRITSTGIPHELIDASIDASIFRNGRSSSDHGAANQPVNLDMREIAAACSFGVVFGQLACAKQIRIEIHKNAALANRQRPHFKQ